jgi:tetratricopeptide (TPR) repeat protein
LINKSIAARPDFRESYQLRALIHLAHMNFTAAERDARKAIELKPKAHAAYNTLGQVFLAQKRFDDAKDAYREALRQAPENALYRYYLGFSHYQLQAYRQAAESLATATQVTLPIVEYDLLAHYYLGRSLEALAETEQAQQVYQEMRNFKEGLPTLKDQLQEQPDYAHLRLMRADLADLERRLAS